MTEEAILQGCLKNHAAAQKELYNRYSPKMLAVCYRFAHNREDAEDMLQEGFIKVFLQMHTFQSKGAFEGWIRRIIVHTCINHLKKEQAFQRECGYYSGKCHSGEGRKYSFHRSGKTDCGLYSPASCWISNRVEPVRH